MHLCISVQVLSGSVRAPLPFVRGASVHRMKRCRDSIRAVHMPKFPTCRAPFIPQEHNVQQSLTLFNLRRILCVSADLRTTLITHITLKRGCFVELQSTHIYVRSLPPLIRNLWVGTLRKWIRSPLHGYKCLMKVGARNTGVIKTCCDPYIP